jgi:hypothetical protein
MNNRQEWQVWDDRWQALNRTMINLPQEFSEDLSRKTTLTHLLQHLQKFAESQFESFFYDGLGDRSTYNLVHFDEYPPEYVLNVVLDQISFDLEVIQRAANQRISGTPQMKVTLAKADNYALDALKPAQTHNYLPENTTVVTYFQKSASIRIIPYAPVALIGIPLTCTTVFQDYLAIPHEVGHYVYRHGKMPNKESTSDYLDKQIVGIQHWARRWVEEIFADVFGTLSGGYAFALDFQEWQLKSSLDEFVTDDLEHPVSVFRPQIFVKVLNKMQPQQMIAQELWNHWSTCRDAWDKSGRFKSGDEKVWIEDAISQTVDLDEDIPVDKIILKVLELFPDFEPTWAGTQVDELYGEFEDKVKGIPPRFNGVEFALPTPENSLEEQVKQSFSGTEFDSSPTEDLWEKWIKEKEFFGKTAEEGNSPPQKEQEEIAPKKWEKVLDADGWATKGPHSRK